MGKFVDITGRKFGLLTAVERVGTSERGSPLWRVRCDCGTEKNTSRTALYKTRSCGCSKLATDLTGTRFGKLVVLSIESKFPSHTMWVCRCDCGKEKAVNGENLKRGFTQSCGCLRVRAAKWGADAVRLPKGVASKNQVLNQYKQKAKKRNLSWSLTYEEFSFLVTSPCFYCGLPPRNRNYRPENNGAFVYTGIDRVNNCEGYTNINVVPCCKLCNLMKRVLSCEEFLWHIERIHKFQLRKHKGTTAKGAVA